ncbi:MAG: VanZ family protein, partial [Planctomycetota bacterium]
MRHRWVGLVLLLWVAAVLLVATTSGFSATHRAVWGFFHDSLGFTPHAADLATNVVRKSFHLPAYALVGALLWGAIPPARRKPLLVLLAVLLIAATDEILQGILGYDADKIAEL